MTDEPSKLVEAIEVAKATKRIVVQNIVLALTVKVMFVFDKTGTLTKGVFMKRCFWYEKNVYDGAVKNMF